MKLKCIINIFGGPSCGKSLVATGLFSKMKALGYNVEYVNEYAKELTYEKRKLILSSDQLYIFAKQHRKIYRLIDEVEYIITDGPILLSSVYYKFSNGTCYHNDHFNDLVLSTHNNYHNLNIYLIRNKKYKYEEVGRSQNEIEAKLLDAFIKNYLKINKISVTNMISNRNTINKIFYLIKRFSDIINNNKYSYIFKTEKERLNFIPSKDDLDKLAFQKSDKTIWVLKDIYSNLWEPQNSVP